MYVYERVCARVCVSVNESVFVNESVRVCVCRPTEVGVLHGFRGRQPLLVVVAQQLVQQVQGLWAHQVLVLRLDKLLPALPRLPRRRKRWMDNKKKEEGCG